MIYVQLGNREIKKLKSNRGIKLQVCVCVCARVWIVLTFIHMIVVIYNSVCTDAYVTKSEVL